jgi:hypothetical protein
MDLLSMYYYAGIPVITCNMLFYSMSAISSSITSSQNVVKFISEHKDNDVTIFKNELELMDLTMKLKIVETLVFDILKKYCKNEDEFEIVKNNMRDPLLISDVSDSEFALIEMKNKITIFDKMDEPIRHSLLSTSEIVQKINGIITKAQEKILTHEQSYLNKLITLSLHNEINQLKKQVIILDKRLDLLLKLLVIYMK